MRCYISRVENGHKVPSLETLERFALALELPLYRLFYEGKEPPPTPHLTARPALETLLQGEGKNGPDPRFLRKLGTLCSRMGDSERQVVMNFAKWLAARTRGVSLPNPVDPQDTHDATRPLD